MAILETEVLIRLDGKVVKHYEALGYKIPRRKDKQGRMKMPKGTEILVKINDLTQRSNVKVTKVCDDCGKEVPQSYGTIMSLRKENKFKDGKDRCFQCARVKTGDLLVERHMDNCVANTDEEFAKLFWNEKDTHRYTCKSSRSVDFKCPNCGFKVKEKKINDIHRQGLSCSRCSDGLSYPEKFVSSALSQLGLDFITQKRFSWAKDKIYDVYVESLSLVIEIHGIQHYEESTRGRTLVEEMRNDAEKMNLSNENGLRYVAIDAKISEYEYLINSIENGELSNLINFNNVDWIECHRYSCGSLVSEAWRLWETGMKSTRLIADALNINYNTAKRYLKRGADAGLCSYSVEEAYREAGKRRVGQRLTPVVQLSLDGGFVKKYEGIKIAIEELGIQTKNAGNNIGTVCKGRQKTAYGYKWMYLSEYEKMSQLVSS
jgi:hypothetical protein